MNSIIEEEKDSELNESNFSMSRVSREFTDSLAISNSFENVLKKLFQFEEKKINMSLIISKILVK